MKFAADFIVAGVTKAGTTSLFTYLNAHPDVCGSSVKEVDFFLPLRFMEPMQPLEEYSQYFNHCPEKAFKVEASPAYYYGAERVAGAIKEALPEAKLLIIFRNPVSRFVSFFKFHQNRLRLPHDMTINEYFEKCRGLDREYFLKKDNYLYFGLLSGGYEAYLDPWMEIFGDNLKVEFFENFVQDTKEFTKSLCRWLGLDEGFYDSYDFLIENKTRGYKNRFFHGIAHDCNQRFEMFFRKNIGLKRFLRDVYFKINGAAQKKGGLDEALMQSLSAYYAASNKALRKKLEAFDDIHLPSWLEE